MTRILLIRHAMTAANGKCLAGRMPGVRLDGTGQRQAQALAARLADVPIAAIYSSPMERAVATAAPVATLRGLQVVCREEFTEINFGEWTGCTLEELAGDSRFRQFNAFRSGTPVPGGESMLQVQSRMVAGLSRLRDAHPGGCVAVVGHGDPIRSAIAWCVGIPLDFLLRFDVDPASVSVVELDTSTARLLVLNDRGRLPAA